MTTSTSTSPVTSVKASVTRPKTCGAMFAVDATLGSEGCKRLPRHNGEHRATLHRPNVTKPAKASRKAAPKAPKLTAAMIAELPADVRKAVKAALAAARDARIAAAVPHVTELPMADAPRVTVARKAVKREKFVESGKPSMARPAVG